MNFKLILVPKTPDEFLLNGEKPLCGLAFVEKASQCLRRNLDHLTKTHHQTLGRVAKYEISIPQALAIESGWFDQRSVRYLTCEANCLEKFIFYGAAMNNTPTNRPVYPYYENGVTLYSYVDELAFLESWRVRGYPEEYTIVDDNTCDMTIVPDEDVVKNPTVGDVILDDLLDGK